MTEREICNHIIKRGKCTGISCSGISNTTDENPLNIGTECPLRGREPCYKNWEMKAQRWLNDHKDKPMTQNRIILAHLKNFKITQAEAYESYGILRLSARIHDLRSMGYPIEMELKTEKNRFGAVVTFSEYSMGGKK